jgi:hypothetical protein
MSSAAAASAAAPAASSGAGFELSYETLQGDASASHLASVYHGSALEEDFLRFHSRSHVAVVVAGMAVYGLFYVIVAAAGDFIAALVAGVSLLTAALQVIFVACRTPMTTAEELLIARRQERIGIVGVAVIIVLLDAFYHASYLTRCEANQPGRVRACVASYGGPAIRMAIVSVCVRPRLAFIAPLNMLSLVVYTISAAMYYDDAVNVVVDAISACGYMVAMCIAAGTLELQARRQFLSLVTTQRADRDVEQQAAGQRAVLAAVLPAALTVLGAKTDATHHRRASVCISDIYNFAQWSTGYLEVDVVAVLHLLITTYDTAVESTPFAERAMSYGDCYVVCVGLLEPVPDHRAIAMEFAALARSVAAVVNECAGELQFATRVAVNSGDLIGAAVGAGTLRYVVTGAAFDGAKMLLADCAADCVVVSADDAVAAEVEGSQSRSRDAVAYDASSVADAGEPLVDYSWSKLWLRFNDAAVQQRMDAAARDTVVYALMPAVAIAGIACGMLVELAARDDRQHHTSRPIGLGLLYFALALAWTHVGLLGAFPAHIEPLVVLNVPLAVCCLVALLASLAIIECQFAEASGSGFLIVCAIRKLNGVSWIAQAALLLTAMVPAFYWDLTGNQFFSAGKLLTTFVVTPVLCIGYRYWAARVALQQFAAHEVAEASLLVAYTQSDAMEGLLEGLLPPHVPMSERVHARLVAASHVVPAKPHYVRLWCGMTILQIHVTFTERDGFGAVAAAWGKIEATVRTECSLLELVQATGDEFLIAGPFLDHSSDDSSVSAARGAMQILLSIAEALGSSCNITAVASAGNTYGTLVGAALLTYRLFGAAMRENDAIMAAAPRMSASSPVRPVAEPGRANMVFLASQAFVKQECNFVLPRAAPAVVDGSLSVVVAPNASTTLVATESRDPARRGSHSDGRRVAFSAPMLWRVRALGVAEVSTVRVW